MFRLCCVLSLVLGLLAASVSSVRAEEKRIGVVNVSRVFNAYQKVKDVQERMEKLFEAERNNIQKDGLDLKKWQDRLSVETRDPKKDINLFKEFQRFELAKMELDLRFQNLATDVEKKRKEEMKLVLNDIKGAIRAVGVQEKFDLVLRAPEFDDEFDPNKPEEEKKDEGQSAAELVRKFRENPVMYFSQGVDVTQKVIDRLNGDYKAAAPVNAPPSPAVVPDVK
jgi:Skp family chaperone for outer membrane proteins